MKRVKRPHAPTQARREKIRSAGSPRRTVSWAFLRELRSLDPALELVWWNPRNYWVLYRVVERGIVPAGDLMKKELVLTGPRGEMREPGYWLIDWLKRNDLCTRYSHRLFHRDPDRARRLYVQDLMRDTREHEAAVKEKREDEMAQSFAEEAYVCAKGTFSGTWATKPKKNPAAKRLVEVAK